MDVAKKFGMVQPNVSTTQAVGASSSLTQRASFA
jgi:hypothetical protein